MWTEPEIASFITRLKHVIAWTDGLAEYFDFEKGDYSKVFRKTNPLINGTALYRFGDRYVEWDHNYDPKLYEQLMELITTSRESHIEIDLTNPDQMGRILSFETCNTIHDGAPCDLSHNFVDIGDVPPIDTWFFLKNNYKHSVRACGQVLFCWIPKHFVPVMQSAIDVEMLDNYQWLDENDPFLYEQITHGFNYLGH